jgi:hypothetical protein
VDVKRAADLYAQGRTLRQIGAELGISSTTVSEQLRRGGVIMRRGGPSSHPASTQRILVLRDQGLTWNEVAKQVDMTVSGAWSRYRRARPPKSPRLGRWQQVLAAALDQTLRLASARLSLIILAERRPGRSSPPHNEPPTVSPPPVGPASCMYRVPMGTPMQAIASIWCWGSRIRS